MKTQTGRSWQKKIWLGRGNSVDDISTCAEQCTGLSEWECGMNRIQKRVKEAKWIKALAEGTGCVLNQRWLGWIELDICWRYAVKRQLQSNERVTGCRFICMFKLTWTGFALDSPDFCIPCLFSYVCDEVIFLFPKMNKLNQIEALWLFFMWVHCGAVSGNVMWIGNAWQRILS